MKKPKEPIKPRRPAEPSKTLPPRKEIAYLHSGVTLGEVLKITQGIDPYKVEIISNIGYYDSIELEAHWTNETADKNPHYEKQLKRYINAIADYEVKIKEYEKLRAQYERDEREYLTQLYKAELAKLERKVGKRK